MPIYSRFILFTGVLLQSLYGSAALASNDEPLNQSWAPAYGERKTRPDPSIALVPKWS